MLVIAALILFAYVLGSLSWSIIICKLCKLPDPRTQGSGNAGATNAMRVGGKKIAFAVLMGDILKGFIPIQLALAFHIATPILPWIGLAAFIGHLFPVYFRLRGGKGVATQTGVLFGLSLSLGIGFVICWLITLAIWRMVSLASLIGAIAVPILSIWLVPVSFQPPLILMTVLIIIRHRDNLGRIVKGEESKFLLWRG